MRPSFASVIGVLSLLAALGSLAVAGVSTLDPGVVAENPGGAVLAVDPRGPAWWAGIRPGQHVVTITSADDAAGWSIETFDDLDHHRFSLAAASAQLRTTIPITVFALVLACGAIALSRTTRRRSELLSALAAGAASVPYLVAEPGWIGAATVVGSALLPAAWIHRRSAFPAPLRRAWLVAALACAVLWLALEQADASVGSLAPALQVSFLVMLVPVLMTAGRLTVERIGRVVAATPTLDALAASSGVVGSVMLLAAGVPVVAVAVVAMVLALGYAKARAAIARGADRLLLAEVREREAMRAAEAERARISREIHDDPLQAIAGVIAQLEDPNADREAARQSLRSVADHLRTLATELHPPVLDDLGLAPAIESVARASTRPCEVALENSAGYGVAERPPAEVELAVYRIVAEAIANALQHARASHIAVRGRVACDAVEVQIADDGVGIAPSRIDEAMRGGHMGIASMRRRAAAIDADLAIEAAPSGGTVVRLRWAT